MEYAFSSSRRSVSYLHIISCHNLNLTACGWESHRTLVHSPHDIQARDACPVFFFLGGGSSSLQVTIRRSSHYTDLFILNRLHCFFPEDGAPHNCGSENKTCSTENYFVYKALRTSTEILLMINHCD
jgi:hypothetical protein